MWDAAEFIIQHRRGTHTSRYMSLVVTLQSVDIVRDISQVWKYKSREWVPVMTRRAADRRSFPAAPRPADQLLGSEATSANWRTVHAIWSVMYPHCVWSVTFRCRWTVDIGDKFRRSPRCKIRDGRFRFELVDVACSYRDRSDYVIGSSLGIE